MTRSDGGRPRDPRRERSAATSRRSYLAGVAAGVGLVAGCASGGSRNGDGPEGAGEGASAGGGAVGGLSEADVPAFSADSDAQPTPMLLAAAVEDGDGLAFLDSFRAALAVGNVGGAAITAQSVEVGAAVVDDEDDFGDSVTEPEPVTVDLPEIDPGEWEPIGVELRVNAGGTWTIAADAREHPAFDPRFEVGPARLGPGESVGSAVGEFEITALEPRFERALHYETEEGGVGMFERDATGLRAAESGNVLALHRFRVKNESEDRSLGFGRVLADNQFSGASLSTETGALVDGERMRDSPDSLVLPGGVPFGDVEIGPGESATLVGIQEIDADDVDDAAVTLSLWGDTADVRFETGGKSPALPDFELVDVAIRTSEGGGESGDPIVAATVENGGDAAGTFRGAAQFHASRPTASDWVYLPEGFAVDLDPGDRATVSVAASRGEERFRVLPFEAEVTL